MGHMSGSATFPGPRGPFLRSLLFAISFLCFVSYTYRSSTAQFEILTFQQTGLPYIEKLTFQGTSTNVRPATVPDCSFNNTDLSRLQKQYSLGSTISFGRRHIRFQTKDSIRNSLTKLDNALFPVGFELIDGRFPPAKAQCLEPLEVTVPVSSAPKTVDASDLLFGISTTYTRFKDPKVAPVKEWAHWLTNGEGKSNGAGLVVLLADANPTQVEEVTQEIKSYGINIQVASTSGAVEMAKRYLGMVPALSFASKEVRRRWLIMGDDDTFYPSMHALVQRLNAYDHTADMYIGTFSEDVNNIQRHGSQAFGGAGVIFSLSLAEKISAKFQECSTPKKLMEANTGWGPQGDILLRKCIYEHTDVRLTLLRDLHQLDIMGDPAGFYESGLMPLSLHHFKGGIWHKANPHAGAQIMHACGEACFLQRFLSKDNFILSNGFSIAYYPDGIDFDVNQMERTFHSAPDDLGWNLDFMLGPGRKSLSSTGRKASWELAESVRLPDGGLKQTYIRKADDARWTIAKGGEARFEMDGIIELIWMF